MSASSIGIKIHVDGIVQGVGFRPFVYNLAKELDLHGWVRNTSSGVDIVITGRRSSLDSFIHELKTKPPSLARIDNITINPSINEQFTDFSIIASQPIMGDFIPISPDVSICPDCTRELFDPNNRRYRYPFINCTNCGPRFSIIKDIPYDRPNTTMADFNMCPDCLSEYQDPSDRRYHAQPTACAVCGPKVKFIEKGKPKIFEESAIQAARSALKAGKIVAIKGLGGYHLACDAKNQDTLNTLRQRKLRSEKPFALMAFDISTIRKYVKVTQEEELLLKSPQHPIVLLRKHPDIHTLDHTAPSQKYLGFMLPYTPEHLLLLEPASGFPEVLVMTSGNLSEEPISFIDSEASDRLSDIADCFLVHDRPIHMRVDDSVVRVINNSIYPLRRGRGYAPEPFRMARKLASIFACGAELKNTYALSREQYIFLSHHIGDMENLETLGSYRSAYTHFKTLFRIRPQAIAVDLHPDYLATRFGQDEAVKQSLPLISVQHHHAHLAACLADNNLFSDEPVIGLIFDGTGYGSDGHIWGGEVLTATYSHYNRSFHLQEAPLPGGDSAIRNPSKIALAFLDAAGIEWSSDLPPAMNYSDEELNILKYQIEKNINCIPTSSMGRLFDAVSSLLGIRQRVSYEGQAAIELENLHDPNETSNYEVAIRDGIIESLALLPQILEDIKRGLKMPAISAKFHNTIAHVCFKASVQIRKDSGYNRIALSGGVWQNITLLNKTVQLLEGAGFEVLLHRQVPTNDGGIALGQLMIADAILKL
jgi:hydrogenase maturation protein HypF